MKAYRKFLIEIEMLESLHASTLFSYDQTTLRLNEQRKEGFLDPKEPISRTLKGGNDFKLGHNLKSLRKKLYKDYRVTLRETVFVRLISILEVFLVDSIREVLISRKDVLCKTKKSEELSYNHLLSFKNSSEILTHILNKECRNLHSGGFKEICKYYKTKLEVNINNAGNSKIITEYHDRRHLLVHKLGVTDKKYREKYNCNDDKISVPELYLINALIDIRKLASYIEKEATKFINLGHQVSEESVESTMQINVTILDTEGLSIISQDFLFDFGESLVQLKDLRLQKKKIENQEYELMISGNGEHLTQYLSILEGHRNTIQVDGYRSINLVNEACPKIISDEMLEKVAMLLPPQPWETGIHKKISKSLGISNKYANKAINALIKNGTFKKQIDGVVIEDDADITALVGDE